MQIYEGKWCNEVYDFYSDRKKVGYFFPPSKYALQ